MHPCLCIPSCTELKLVVILGYVNTLSCQTKIEESEMMAFPLSLFASISTTYVISLWCHLQVFIVAGVRLLLPGKRETLKDELLGS